MADADLQPPMRRAFEARLGIGLAQGLVIYGLQRWRLDLAPMAFGGLFLAACLVPIVALGALGVLRKVTLWSWLAAATLITCGLGAYDRFVGAGPESWGSPRPFVFIAATLFILHHLITPADAERRWRAGYGRYFDEGWKDAVRLVLAALFVGALWVLLFLGAALFHLLGLDFLQRLLGKTWFSIPVTTTFFAIAVHLTDVRVELVRGARTLALTLLSWLLPVLTLLTAGFLLALPFTGLKPLWATRSATGIMLAACAALVILINAAYQEGERPGFPPMALKWATRIAGVVLAPLVAIAAYGLALRIGQHGFSPSRIYACACLLIAACYAGGYVWAAASRGPWMRPLETTNWLTAQVAVAVLLLIFSPVLDPARISVADQTHRLAAGRIAPKDFDYAFLHFGAGRWGRAALDRLAVAGGDARSQAIAELAKAELKRKNRWERPQPPPSQRVNLVHPLGGALPAGFLDQVWSRQDDPAGNCDPSLGCEALTAELDGQPGLEVVVFGQSQRRVYGYRDGRWTPIGTLDGVYCPQDRQALRSGNFNLRPPAAQADLEIAGRRLAFVETTACPAPPTKARPR